MNVSQFELIFKPQSPVAPGGSGPVDEVLQGYFLEITNLEPVDYRYSLDFISIPGATPNRSIAGNTLFFVDTPGTDNAAGVLNGPFGSNTFRPSTGSILIPANGTALVAVLPSAFGPLPGDMTPITTPDFEVRGYVRLRLPALFPPGPPFFVTEPQSEEPVRVLLTAQNRASYIRTNNGRTIAQTQASVPLSTGQGENLITPDPGGPIFEVPDFDSDLVLDFESILQSTQGFEVPAMAALLAQMNPEGSDLRAFNKMLAEADVPFAIERRKR